MGLSIRAQSLSLLWALLLGMGLGLLYDMLRPIRRRSGDLFWDLLFCLCASAAAFLFVMRTGSARGIGETLFCTLGLFGYFQLLSPLLLPVFDKLDRAIRVFWIFTQNAGKKVSQTAKKLFQKLQE